MRLTREYLIEKQGPNLPGYFIMVEKPTPNPINVNRTFDQALLVEDNWMDRTLTLIMIKLDDAEKYDLATPQKFYTKDQKIPVCIKR
jgi:hypothetical protein